MMKGKKTMGISNSGGCMSDMMKMMGQESDTKFSPADMCRRMMEAVSTTAEMTGFATPEVRSLFEDWMTQVEAEILDVVQRKGRVTATDIAQELKISEDSALYFISKLIRDKKLSSPGYELSKDGGM